MVEILRSLSNITTKSHNFLLNNFLLPLGDRLLQQGMLNHLRFLREAQWWPVDRILSFRDERLRHLIHVAHYEVPYYKNIFDQTGISPSDIQSASDLVRLPISTKRMFRRYYPEKTCRKTGFRTFEACSSGSTGENFRVLQDIETKGILRALTVLSLEWGGWKFGIPHLQTGMSLERGIVKRLKDIMMRCCYVSAFDLTDEHLDKMLRLIDRRRIRHLMGYAASLFEIAQRADEVGFSWQMDSVISWGDNLFEHYRKKIENTFNCRVTDTYGCAEGIVVAAQCGHGSNFHIFSTDVIMEIVNDDGDPVSPGDIGNVILTRLHPGSMPLIRYRVGDLGGLSKDNSCSCGRGFEILSSIQGRDTDIVLTSSGNRLIVHFFTGVLEHFREITMFQVVQDKIDGIRLLIVPSSYFGSQTESRILKALADKGAEDLAIDIEIVDEIPTTPSGKRRFVISNLVRESIDG